MYNYVSIELCNRIIYAVLINFVNSLYFLFNSLQPENNGHEGNSGIPRIKRAQTHESYASIAFYKIMT